MKNSVITLLILLLTAGVFFIFSGNEKRGSRVLTSETQTVMQTPEPEKKVAAKPKRLKIAALGIDSLVEEVGRDEKGGMGIPGNDGNVAWWKYGAVPGETGNAVIAGHYDKKNGGPAVFYNLNDLDKGDEIVVEDENGENNKFVVLRSELFKDNNFPLELVFGVSDGINLNLITCDGIFDRTSGNYSDRLVVFSRLMQ